MTSNIIDLNSLSIENVKLLNEINKELKDEYHELVEQIFAQTDQSIDWLVNSLLSRNNFLSSIFLDLCYIELVKRIEKKEKFEKVVVKSPAQKNVLQEYFRNVGSPINVFFSESFLQRLKRFLTPYYSFLQNIQTTVRLFTVGTTRRQNTIPKDKEITLIDIFFIPSMFEKGVYNNRYYPGLLYHLDEKERKKIFFVPTILIRKKLKEILNICEKAGDQFLFKFDYLKFRDYFFALLSALRIKKINLESFEFRGFRVGPILRSDFAKNIANGSSFIGLLNYRFFRRLKERGVQLKLVIDWFENQVVDRGFNKGKNEFFPDVKSIGYEGFIVSYDYNFYLQPSLCEYKAGVLPDHIAVTGSGVVNGIKKYFPEISVITASAFRFDSIYKCNLSNLRPNNNPLVILATLPISKRQSRDILDLLIEYTELEKDLSTQVLIKSHPVLNMNQIRSSWSSWPEQFKILDGNFSEIISTVDLMVGNTSSTCMEALAYGVPVIIVGNQDGITQNPIPNSVSKTMWELCYTVDEFKNAVKRLCTDADKRKSTEYIDVAKKIREEYFELVTREGVMKFLNLDEGTEGV